MVGRVSGWALRLLSLFGSLVFGSLMGIAIHRALPQAVTKRDAFVEHEAFTAPAALGFRHAFEIFQDAALEVINLGKPAREQIGAGLFATDAAGAEHRDLAMFCRIEV